MQFFQKAAGVNRLNRNLSSFMSNGQFQFNVPKGNLKNTNNYMLNFGRCVNGEWMLYKKSILQLFCSVLGNVGLWTSPSA